MDLKSKYKEQETHSGEALVPEKRQVCIYDVSFVNRVISREILDPRSFAQHMLVQTEKLTDGSTAT